MNDSILRRKLWRLCTLGLLLIALAVSGFVQTAQPANANVLTTSKLLVVPARWVHVTTTANIVNQSTYLDHAATNGNPNALILVTQHWNQSWGGVFNPHPIGVWYNTTKAKWAIFNQDIINMTPGIGFNVQVLSASSSAFVHKATSASIGGNSTFIDNPATNGKPNARLLVAQNWNPGGVGGTYNKHNIGVWYSSSKGKWAIFNQDIASMPLNAAFNIKVLPSASNVWTHKVTSANRTGATNFGTFLDNAVTNSKPNVLVQITPNWNPGGVGGTYNNHQTGVYYNSTHWTIFNEDIGEMPISAAFNIEVMQP